MLICILTKADLMGTNTSIDTKNIAYVICYDNKTLDYVLMNRLHRYLLKDYPFIHEKYDNWTRVYIFTDTYDDISNPLYMFETGVNFNRYKERFKELSKKYKLRNYVGEIVPHLIHVCWYELGDNDNDKDTNTDTDKNKT